MAASRIARGWLGLAAALLLAPAAGALDITGLTLTLGGTNTANGIQDSGNNRFQVASSTSVTLPPIGPVADTIGSVFTFQTRYAALVAQDREGGSATGAQSETSNYTITFTIVNPFGHTYQVDISTLRVGALTLVDDEGTTSGGSATLGAVTGTLDSIVNGSLALAAFPTLSGTGGGVSPFNQTGSTLTITDNALTRTFVLGFTWTASATSTRDEAAVRMGIPGSMNNATTADDYSLDGRSVSGDGHFVNVATTIISAPEPAPAALLVLGLVGLALRARAKSQRA